MHSGRMVIQLTELFSSSIISLVMKSLEFSQPSLNILGVIFLGAATKILIFLLVDSSCKVYVDRWRYNLVHVVWEKGL